jgi:hypothetical protein
MEIILSEVYNDDDDDNTRNNNNNVIATIKNKTDSITGLGGS